MLSPKTTIRCGQRMFSYEMAPVLGGAPAGFGAAVFFFSHGSSPQATNSREAKLVATNTKFFIWYLKRRNFFLECNPRAKMNLPKLGKKIRLRGV